MSTRASGLPWYADVGTLPREVLVQQARPIRNIDGDQQRVSHAFRPNEYRIPFPHLKSTNLNEFT